MLKIAYIDFKKYNVNQLFAFFTPLLVVNASLNIHWLLCCVPIREDDKERGMEDVVWK